MKLMAGDARGAFLHGKRIQHELYFRVPSGTGPCKIPGLVEGSLLRLNKSIYGTNTAASAWYLAIVEILIVLGWTQLKFEPATFVWRSTENELFGILCLHVGDMLMALDVENHSQMKEAVGFGAWKDIHKEACAFNGRRFKQAAGYAVTIDMDEYRSTMTDYRMTRERHKQDQSPLTPSEHRALRGINGQIQWARTMIAYENAFAASKLAGARAKPMVAELKEANKVIRALRRQQDRPLNNPPKRPSRDQCYRTNTKYKKSDAKLVK